MIEDFCREHSIGILKNEPLFKHTTFRIGGPCDYMISPYDSTQIQDILCFFKDNGIPYIILGNGSNYLFPDEGYRGVVLNLKYLDYTFMKDGFVTAGAGTLLSKVAIYALNCSMSGMEFTHGIPGTVGGAIYMNAGAYGGCMDDICFRTTYCTPDGQLHEITGMEHNFSYKKSFFTGTNNVICECTFLLHPDKRTLINAKMKEMQIKRKESQPLEFPSAGSFFKRPESHFAGKLIEDCGLKGFSVGDAQVSEKHAGFIINKGNATYNDVIQLKDIITEKVMNEFGVKLEPEVVIL